MSWKTTLSLVVVAALLGGYYYWYEVKGGAQRQAAQEATQRIFQLDKGAVDAVTIRRGDEVIKLAKDPHEGWVLTEPVRAHAEQRTVDDVLEGLVEGKRERVISEQATDLDEFGLSEPSLVVEATGQDGAAPVVLQIGARTPTFGGYYARPGDASTVLTIPTSLQAKLDKTVFNLRDKKVLSLDQTQVKRVEVHQGEQRIAVEAAGEQEWKLVAPLEAKADRAKITELLSAINGATVKEFVEEAPQDLTPYGLQPPSSRLAFFLGDERAEKSLLLGAEDTAKGGLYAKRGAMDNVFVVETTLLDKVPKDASDWRDRRLMAFKRDEVERFEIHAGQDVTEVVCVEHCGKIPDDRWQIKQPLEARADAIKVRTWLRNLEELNVKTFIVEASDDLAPYGLDQPEARLRAWLRDRSEPVTVLLGQPDVDHGGHYVKLPERPAVYLIDMRDGDELLKKASDLRDRKMLAFRARDVRKIEMSYPDSAMVIEGDGDNWQQVQPTRTKLDAHRVRSLLWKLEDLEFKEEWQPTAVAAEDHGLETPAATLTLWEQGGKTVDTLKLGRPVEGHAWVYAQLASSPMLYAVDAQVLEGLPRGAGDI